MNDVSNTQLANSLFCQYCGAAFKPRRKWQKACSNKCRMRLNRKKAIPTFTTAQEAEDYIVRCFRSMRRQSTQSTNQ